MPRCTFGRLARPVATAFIVGNVAAIPSVHAYAPQGDHPDAPERVQLHATIGPMRPTRGEKSGLPSRLKPTVSEPEEAEESIEEDPHSADQEAISMPDTARAGLGDVVWDVDALPAAVAAKRAALLEAARSGNIDALRPLFSAQTLPPLVSAVVQVDDPVAFLQNESGDAEGREILAIMIEILETGHVFIAGDGTYVWPYFAEVPLDELGPRNLVELYRILTSLDVEAMERQGRYTFYRIGITTDGRLRYFSAGDLE